MVLQSGLLGWEEASDIKNPLGVKVTVRPFGETHLVARGSGTLASSVPVNLSYPV